MNVRCGVQLVQRHPQMLLLPESIYFLSWVLVVLFSFLYGAILVSLRQLRAYGLYPNTLYFFFNEVIHSSPACLRKKKRKQRCNILFLETEKIKQGWHIKLLQSLLIHCTIVAKSKTDGSDWLVYDDRNTAQHYK